MIPAKTERDEWRKLGVGEYTPEEFTVLLDAVDELEQQAFRAIELAVRFGGADGADHKAWVIDQMVRILASDSYGKIVADARNGEDGPETYAWDVGIAP